MTVHCHVHIRDSIGKVPLSRVRFSSKKQPAAEEEEEKEIHWLNVSLNVSDAHEGVPADGYLGVTFCTVQRVYALEDYRASSH